MRKLLAFVMVVFTCCAALFLGLAGSMTWDVFTESTGLLKMLAAGQLIALIAMAGGIVFGTVLLVTEKEKP